MRGSAIWLSVSAVIFLLVQYTTVTRIGFDEHERFSTRLDLGSWIFGDDKDRPRFVAVGTEKGMASITHSHICIIGNAQSVDAATAFHAHFRYHKNLRALWAIWGSEAANAQVSLSAPHDGLYFLGMPNSTWAQGIAAGYQEIQRLRWRCGYYFVVDDDARFSLVSNDDSRAHNNASLDENDDYGNQGVVQEIIRLLDEHRPAVLSFAWENGLRNSPALRNIYKIFQDEPTGVQPLTGFDNGNIIYHESLMPLLLPFAPHHEGPWHGEWTLSATWLQLFLPRMYPGKAMVAHTVLYSNKLNFNANGAGHVTVDKATGLATHEGSRHPYEWPLKDSYAAYLAAGLKEDKARVGADMELEDMGGAIPRATRTNNQQQDFTDFLRRFNGFYDLLHPAVAERPYIKERYTHYQLLELRRGTPIVLKLFVFTVDRLASLRRLIQSLLLARYDLLENVRAVDLTVLVDLRATARSKTTSAIYSSSSSSSYEDPEAVQASVIGYVRTIAWSHGRLNVRAAVADMGLKRSIMEAWTPTSPDEFAVFLEDDIEVSPYFAYWAERAVRTYHYGQDRPLYTDRMVGVSLYAPRRSQVRDMAWSPEMAEAQKIKGTTEQDLNHRSPRYEPYLFQLPCSWGAVYFPRPWSSFQRWYGRHRSHDPLLPDHGGVNRWPHERSWKKYLARFMVETGGFMLYPYLPDGLSLSTLSMEVGSYDAANSLPSPVERYSVPLLRGSFFAQQLAQMLPMPPLEALRAFDIYEQPTRLVSITGRQVAGVNPPVPLPNLMHLPLPTIAMQHFAKFTIVVPSYGSRASCLTTFIRHYEALPHLDRIIVVWNAGPVPRNLASNRTTVEVLLMESNDLNNRFLPHKELQTSAVLSLDDDVLIDLADVEFAFYTWQLHPRSIIGFRWTARGYIASKDTASTSSGKPATNNCSYIYRSPVPQDLTPEALQGYQLALTGAAFVHIEHLRAYSSANDARMRRVRDEVRRLNNCEDIAMNFLVAASINEGPIIVEGTFNEAAMADGDGLWKRPHHYEQRSNCICSIEQLFESRTTLPNVAAFPQIEWVGRPRTPPPRNFDIEINS